MWENVAKLKTAFGEQLLGHHLLLRPKPAEGAPLLYVAWTGSVHGIYSSKPSWYRHKMGGFGYGTEAMDMF